MARKKVLYVITKSVWGGAQRYVYDLATNLPKDGFEAVVVAGGEGALIEKLRGAGIRTIALEPLQKKGGTLSVLFDLVNLRLLFRLIKIFREERPHIIHLNSSKAGGIGAVAAWAFKRLNISALKPKVVFTVHGWPFKEDRPLPSKILIWLTSWFSSLFHDKVILINTADFKTAEKFIPRRKLALIFNGIEEVRFLERVEARKFLAKKMGRPLDDKTLVIGTIAALTATKNKGLPFLIRALHRLKAELPERRCALSIMGGEDEYKNLKEEIRLLGLRKDVHLLGYVPDAARYLKGYDIFALPSLKEGLPYTIMEAMQAGLPVVATKVGGIPDLVSHEENGYVVPPKNEMALGEAIRNLITQDGLRKKFGDRAKEIVRSRFILRDAIKKTSELYHA